jgi:excisionase family DNA binding protein
MPEATITQSAFMTADEVAALLNVQKHTLAVWRCCKRYQLPFVKVGRLIRYRRSDVEQWIENRRKCDVAPAA